MNNQDSIELHFEISDTKNSSKEDEKKYRVIRVNLSESIRLSKYILKKVLVKKNQFEIYPTVDKFTK